MSRQGYHVIGASSSSAALALIKKEGAWFDLLLVDIRMPGMDGIELMEKVKAQRQTARLNLDQLTLPDEILEVMTAYNWPGNVRELENAMQRAVVMAENSVISIKDVFPSRTGKNPDPSDPLHQDLSFQDMRRQVVRDFTRQYLTRTLTDHNGNVTQAAKAMGIRRTSLQRLIRQSGLSSREFKGLGNK